MREALERNLVTLRPLAGVLRRHSGRRLLALMAAMVTFTVAVLMLTVSRHGGAAVALGSGAPPAVASPGRVGDGTVSGCCQTRLTPDATAYRTVVHGDALVVINEVGGSNERELVYSDQSPVETDSSYCARWASGAGLTQNGVGFHISNQGRDAVVLERNVFDKGFWGFVVIYFHDGTIRVGPSVDLGGYLGRGDQDVFPLNFCAQLTGTTLRFAVGMRATPATFGAPGRSATFTVNTAPAFGAAGIGQTGTYIAHVPVGTSATVDQISIDNSAGL